MSFHRLAASALLLLAAGCAAGPRQAVAPRFDPDRTYFLRPAGEPLFAYQELHCPMAASGRMRLSLAGTGPTRCEGVSGLAGEAGAAASRDGGWGVTVSDAGTPLEGTEGRYLLHRVATLHSEGLHGRVFRAWRREGLSVGGREVALGPVAVRRIEAGRINLLAGDPQEEARMRAALLAVAPEAGSRIGGALVGQATVSCGAEGGVAQCTVSELRGLDGVLVGGMTERDLRLRRAAPYRDEVLEDGTRRSDRPGQLLFVEAGGAAPAPSPAPASDHAADRAAAAGPSLHEGAPLWAFSAARMAEYCAEGWDSRPGADGRTEYNPCLRPEMFLR